MMGKFGRKVCCDFHGNVKCILLVDGNKFCIFDETSEEQAETGYIQFGMCPLLPKLEREELIDALKAEGLGIKKRWKG
jgi:hypothetical protein